MGIAKRFFQNSFRTVVRPLNPNTPQQHIDGRRMLNDKSTLPTSSSTQQLPQPDLQRLFAWTRSSTRPLTFRDVVSPYRWLETSADSHGLNVLLHLRLCSLM